MCRSWYPCSKPFDNCARKVCASQIVFEVVTSFRLTPCIVSHNRLLFTAAGLASHSELRTINWARAECAGHGLLALGAPGIIVADHDFYYYCIANVDKFCTSLHAILQRFYFSLIKRSTARSSTVLVYRTCDMPSPTCIWRYILIYLSSHFSSLRSGAGLSRRLPATPAKIYLRKRLEIKAKQK